MIGSFFLAQIESVKRWAEKWQHRLQGHMLVTVVWKHGGESTLWVRDIYTEGGVFWMDPEAEMRLPVSPELGDYTITGS